MHVVRRTLLAALLVLGPSLSSTIADADPCASTSVAEPVSSDAPALRHPEGLLWRIAHPGTAPSHVFGTIHVDDPRVTALPPQVERVFLGASRLVVEIELHPAAQARFAEATRFSGTSDLRQYLDPPTLALLVRIGEKHYGLRSMDLIALKPWSIFTLLSRPRPTSRPVLDAMLQKRATSIGMPTHGLESASELIAVLDSIPLSDQITLLKDAVCQHDLIMEQVRKITESYLLRDLAALVALNHQSHEDEELFDRFMRKLVYSRNRRMVERMSTHLDNGNAFIAVGAMHLPGPQGVLERLERRGYEVSVVY